MTTLGSDWACESPCLTTSRLPTAGRGQVLMTTDARAQIAPQPISTRHTRATAHHLNHMHSHHLYHMHHHISTRCTRTTAHHLNHMHSRHSHHLNHMHSHHRPPYLYQMHSHHRPP